MGHLKAGFNLGLFDCSNVLGNLLFPRMSFRPWSSLVLPAVGSQLTFLML